MEQINPNILLITLIFASIFFITPFLYLLVRYIFKIERSRDDQFEIDGDITAFQGRLQQLFHLHDFGLDQSSIDALPVFLYKEIIGIKDPFDCAFCLTEFEPDDKLRLLPKCSHAFHVECIDTWLLSHSTCPLCRSSLQPDQDLPSSSSPVVFLDSAIEISRYSTSSFASSAMDYNIGEHNIEAEDKVVQVKLGKFRNVDHVSTIAEGGSVGQKELDQRRCFSMGSYEYIMNETSLLRVAVKPLRKKPVARSECGGHSRKSFVSTKRESFSISNIWLQASAKDKMANGENSATALSFGVPLDHESKGKCAVSEVGGMEKNGSEMDLDLEVGSCNNSVVSVESQISQTPSFARSTLLWVMNRQNRMVHL